MSNTVTIQTIEFKNTSQGTSTFGIIVFDEDDQSYDNTWESIPENDFDIIVKSLHSDDSFIPELLSSVMENKKGLYVNNTFYEWKEIEYLFL